MSFYGQNPVLHERRPNRLRGYDYSRYGMYFITICVKDRIECFGNVHDGRMAVNKYGEIVEQQWHWLGNQYDHIELDAFVVMPDHVHGVIYIADDDAGWNNSDIAGNGGVGNDYAGNGNNNVGNGRDCVGNGDNNVVVGNGRDRSLRGKCGKIKPIPELIGAFKTTSSKLIHRAGLGSFRWQKSYYDHIIRDDRALQNIRRYIMNNPAKWDTDAKNRNAKYRRVK